MSNEMIYENLIAFHPGSYIEDVIDDLNVTQAEFAERLGVSPKTISKLVNGEIRLSHDVALKLDRLTGIDYQTWMNLQNAYEKKIDEINESKKADEWNILQWMDFGYIKALGLIKNKRYQKREKLAVWRKLLNISSLTYLSKFNSAVSYRNTRQFDDKAIINSNVMLEIATGIARDITDVKLNRAKLKGYLPEIKKMVKQELSEFYEPLESLLQECGVVLVGLPHLKNSNLNGATKKFNNGSVLLLITDRNKGADIFWFSLMHEIGHILEGDFHTDIDEYNKKEERADRFAREFFIPDLAYEDFATNKDFSIESIQKFSENHQILPCILLGRLKREGYVEYHQYSELMKIYKFASSRKEAH